MYINVCKGVYIDTRIYTCICKKHVYIYIYMYIYIYYVCVYVCLNTCILYGLYRLATTVMMAIIARLRRSNNNRSLGNEFKTVITIRKIATEKPRETCPED